MRTRVLGLLLALLLIGCATEPPPPPPALPLPPPAALGAPILAEQMVVGQFGERLFVCRSLVRITVERAEFVCIDQLGQRLLAIEWDAGGPRTGGMPPGTDLPAGVIAGEIAAMFAGPARLDGIYRAAGISVVETEIGRRLSADGQEILSVSYEPHVSGRWNGRSRLINLRTGHSIDVRSRLVTP